MATQIEACQLSVRIGIIAKKLKQDGLLFPQIEQPHADRRRYSKQRESIQDHCSHRHDDPPCHPSLPRPPEALHLDFNQAAPAIAAAPSLQDD